MGGASIGVAYFVTNRPVTKQGGERVFTITDRMFQPAAKLSVVLGHNLPLAIGMSISLFNGMKNEGGFSSLFFDGNEAAIITVMIITLAIIALIWMSYAVSVIFTYRADCQQRRWFGRPLVQVLVVQGMLVAIGFMTTLVPVVPLPDSVAFVAGTYVVGLVIGGGALAGVAFIDRYSKENSR
jgi:hypothetical protein